MNPAADIEPKEAVERFARLSTADQNIVMATGRRIETLADLEGLPEADVERLQPVIESQTPTP